MAFNSTVASTISVFYAAALGRTPVPDSSLPDFGDLGGLAFWTDAFLAGEGDLAQYNDNIYAIADFFVASDEFEARYPTTLTDEEYVTALYNNLLGRGPDADGLVFWVGELEGGASRGKILADFTNSEEAQEFNPTQQAAMQSFIALLAANEGMVTPEQATEWVTENPTLDAAVIDNPEAPTLTLAAALAALAADELPEQYLIDPTEPVDVGAVTVEAAQAVYPQVVEVLTGALNAAALPADLFAWAILDTATNILAAADDPAVTGAGSVALSEGVSVAQITPMSAVANFDGVYAVADTLTNLTEQPASVIALINGATEIAVTGQIAIADLAQVTTLYGDQVTGYNLLDTAANLTDEANAAIVAAATTVEVDGAVTVAEHADLVDLLGEDFGYTLADTFANLLAAPELVAGATTYALTDEPGSLGRLLDDGQIAILEGATNGEEYSYAVIEFASAAPTVKEGNTLAFTVTLTDSTSGEMTTVTEPVTVDFQLIAADPNEVPNSGTNQANLNDFAAASFNPETVTIAAGESTATFDVEPLDDGITELPEGFSVTAEVNDGFWTGEVEATILDGVADDVGQTFTLTVGEDVLTGTAGNDTFNAPIVQSNIATPLVTLEDIDVLDGGDGTDTLNATVDGTLTGPRISNIEILNLRGTTGTTTIDFADITGAEQIWNSGSTVAGNLVYDNAPIAATFGVRNTLAATDINTFDDVSGDADVLNLALSGAGNAVTAAAVSSGGDAAAIEGLNVSATGNNFVDLSAFSAAETLTLATAGALELEVDGTAMTDVTITGSGDLELTEGAQFAALENLTATGFSGDLAVDVSGTAALASVATGAGDDTVAIDGTLLVAAAELSIDLGEGDNTLRLAGIVSEGELADLVFTDTDLTIAGVSTLALADAITLTGNGTLDLDGIAPSALVFEGAVALATFTLALDNTAAALDITFEADVTSTTGTLDFGDAAETVVLTAKANVAGAGVLELTGEALASLTLNLEEDADIDVGLTEEALETVVINATGDLVGTNNVAITISGDATVGSEFSLTSLTLADATDDGDASFVITLENTVNLTTINVSGGEDTDFDIDASAAVFAGVVTINIGNFGVDADGDATGAFFYYEADTVGNKREIFKFVGDDFGNVEIDDFLAGVGGNADRLDFSVFAGVTGLDDLNITWDGFDTTITSDAFAGEITVFGVDLSTDAFNFIF